jgi:DNA-binding LacI/PurR family transcriptional regulator
MPRKPIYTEVIEAIERRVAAGEFMLKGLPGERKLAEELGVSYMTARKAVLRLIDKQVLARKTNGSLIVHPLHQGQGVCQVTLLTPAYPSAHFLRARLAVAEAAGQRNALFRPAEYVHWDDAIVRDALDGSDGLIVMPSTEPIPARLMTSFAEKQNKVVFLDADETAHGIPSIRLFAHPHIAALFEHLWELGHRRIDCFNAQGHADEIHARVNEWRTWLADRGGEGELWDHPTPPYGDVTPNAHKSMLNVLSECDHDLSAIVCTTQPAAVGVIRACRDKGLEVGRDVSVCTINNEPTGRFSVPSLTGLEMPDLAPLLGRCFDWFASEDEGWSGDLLIEPDEPQLFKGESTAPPKA